MKTWVMGAGAIGSVLGGYLADAGQDVVLVGRRREHVRAVNEKGLFIDGSAGERLVRVRAVTPEELHSLGAQPDVVILTVKAFDTESALKDVVPYLGPHSAVVSVQNGMNVELMVSIIGEQCTIGGVSQYGSCVVGPGHVRFTGRVAKHVIGELSGRATSRVQRIAQTMSKAIPTEVSTNIWGLLWAKLIHNSFTNPLSAVSGYAVDALFADRVIRELAMKLALEGLAVSDALAIRLEPLAFFDSEDFRNCGTDTAAAEKSLISYGNLYAGAKPSTLQDIEQGKKTEIDFLNGYIVKKGKELGIPVPGSEACLRMVKEVEGGIREIGYSGIEELSRLLASQ